MEYKKKLIEVALPLDVINKESQRDKYLSSGHPTTLHYWWAPRPLAACRAIVFASLVDDPSEHPERFSDLESQKIERDRLFDIIERLILWENRNDSETINEAKAEILKYNPDGLPVLFDPFCGRGLIPFEGQRLGLEVVASDLNPVPALISKVLLELLPKVERQAAVNPQSRDSSALIEGNPGGGFVEDVKYYADIVLENVKSHLGDMYPSYLITEDLADQREELSALIGQELTVIGWLWARTAKCSNPGCGATIPLTGSFWLSKKAGKRYWLEPSLQREPHKVSFEISHGEGSAPDPTKLPRTSASFKCPSCGQVSDSNYIESLGRNDEIGSQLMACIADGGRGLGRVYLPPDEKHIQAANVRPDWVPDMPIPNYSQAMPTMRHGVRTWADMFTPRQLKMLSTFADEIRRVRAQVISDAGQVQAERAISTNDLDSMKPEEYGNTIVSFLGLILGKLANRACAFCFWDTTREGIQQPFARQGIQKSWDYVESNPFSGSSGSWKSAVEYPIKIAKSIYPGVMPGTVFNADARTAAEGIDDGLIITDPPYFDNMGYADLSDFFYIWLRRALADVHPHMFGTLLTPKAEELTAIKHRFGGDAEKAQEHFVRGFRDCFSELIQIQTEECPLSFFYSYRQKETSAKNGKPAASGWDTMLQGLHDAGIVVVGTWPMLSESTATIKKTKSALMTSVVLVCRKRPKDAPTTNRRKFINELKSVLPEALSRMQDSNIAPVDFAQSAIGPGMGVFTSYNAVIEADGSPMTVRTALGLINEVVHQSLTEQESDFDPDTRWALAWFEEYGFSAESYGRAESLSKAKDTSISGLVKAGIVEVAKGRVRLLCGAEMGQDWDPVSGRRLTIWEATHYLIECLKNRGESAAADLAKSIGPEASVARDLAYRLYQICEKKKRIEMAVDYNSLVISWGEISRMSAGNREGIQTSMDLGDN